ncbi:hypothetical protein BU24DRAFT_425741 [Aaosphaeria arxii CBS 175.79]|uniref:Uncharacterized protein n=1 Tax=Aaosphaeria arxii CBS 175.79 TaxID=1450172 RepID=A0A6A5XGG0_9PLEO|nr:uncharacterized protein BU24DRAFT_425741 [Aaosphaeria arxii CBS 175.79]KAF2011911.1 hypothetical protein BU24DRAFT_425741 [Aaosphaeria arxii CBS 175.79]
MGMDYYLIIIRALKSFEHNYRPTPDPSHPIIISWYNQEFAMPHADRMTSHDTVLHVTLRNPPSSQTLHTPVSVAPRILHLPVSTSYLSPSPITPYRAFCNLLHNNSSTCNRTSRDICGGGATYEQTRRQCSNTPARAHTNTAISTTRTR